MTLPLFPFFAQLENRLTLVVGGGVVAQRKIKLLLKAKARIEVVARQPNAWIQALAQSQQLRLHTRDFKESDLNAVWLVVVATDQEQTNEKIAALAAQRQIFANVVDDPQLSSVQVPALIDRAPLSVAVSSAGAAPMVARFLRQKLETMVGETWGPFTQWLAEQRARICQAVPDLDKRRLLYEWLIEGPAFEAVQAQQWEQAELCLQQALATFPSAADDAAKRSEHQSAAAEQLAHTGGKDPSSANTLPVQTGRAAFIGRDTYHDRQAQPIDESLGLQGGQVWLVGAGPGAPDLLTLHALRALNKADVILYDRLVSKQVLERARRDAKRVYVGKQVGEDHQATQERIHRLLLAHAQAGKNVVRLKGGDSFVFGRGGEEVAFLQQHGVRFGIIPGVTAALACAAYAGVPLTQRGLSKGVAFVHAGAHRADLPRVDSDHTLAVYMGVGQLKEYAQQLQTEAGFAAQTPCLLIERGTRPEQRSLLSDLATVAAAAQTHQIQAPALLLVGAVTQLARAHHWFGEFIDAGAMAGESTDSVAATVFSEPIAV